MAEAKALLQQIIEGKEAYQVETGKAPDVLHLTEADLRELNRDPRLGAVHIKMGYGSRLLGMRLARPIPDQPPGTVTLAREEP